ncbi:MAG TPA: hypothetical protein VFW45_05930 [Candidatus Polarisedimenticolia bacterium]|nr:hypothetical protein [Candidatus Polarisedimenticolia bacterium]
MFARSVSFHLKPGGTTEFIKTLEKEILPELRKQKGFQDEIVFVAPNGTDAVGISLWDVKENAEAYARGKYASVLKSMEPTVVGAPVVQSYEVCNSTFHKIPARAAI